MIIPSLRLPIEEFHVQSEVQGLLLCKSTPLSGGRLHNISFVGYEAQIKALAIDMRVGRAVNITRVSQLCKVSHAISYLLSRCVAVEPASLLSLTHSLPSNKSFSSLRGSDRERWLRRRGVKPKRRHPGKHWCCHCP